MVVYIKKNATNEIRQYTQDKKLYSEYSWSEGNYSCDCNRELFFERAIGNEADDVVCGDDRFNVNIEENGKIVYREFEN